MLVSKYFKLNRTQATLDFLDIHIDKDIPVFVDPTALRALKTDWGHHCVSLLQNYFSSVLAAIREGHNERAKSLLSCLNERNEFHLGYSKKKSRGHALGPASAEDIWKSLSKSKAAGTGLLTDLEDAVLFVDGVGPDMLSDAVCNIIRAPPDRIHAERLPLLRHTHGDGHRFGTHLEHATRKVGTELYRTTYRSWEPNYPGPQSCGSGQTVLQQQRVLQTLSDACASETP